MGILKPPSPLADPKSGLSASVLMEKQQAAAASAAAGASNDGNRLAEPRLSDDTKSSGGSHYRCLVVLIKYVVQDSAERQFPSFVNEVEDLQFPETSLCRERKNSDSRKPGTDLLGEPCKPEDFFIHPSSPSQHRRGYLRLRHEPGAQH